MTFEWSLIVMPLGQKGGKVAVFLVHVKEIVLKRNEKKIKERDTMKKLQNKRNQLEEAISIKLDET